MHWLDTTIVLIIFVSLIWGFLRGFTKEVFSILGIVIAYVVAANKGGIFKPFFTTLFKVEDIAAAVSVIVLFVLVFLGVSILGKILRSVIKYAGMGSYDRLFGVLVGFLRGVFVSSLIVLFLLVYSHNGREHVIQSKVALFTLNVTRGIIFVLPKKMKDTFKDEYRKIMKEKLEAIEEI